MKNYRVNLTLGKELHERLLVHKGSRTWKEFLTSWCNHFDGIGERDDEIYYITHAEYKSIMERLDKLESKEMVIED